MSITEKAGDYVGLRSPFPRQLEAGHCSPTAQRWVVRTMTQNFIFPQFITLSCLHSHSVTFPLVYHESFMHHWGDRRGQGNVLVLAEITLAVIAPENLAKLDSPLGVSRGGSAPFCWRSRNQEVPCESLVVKRSLTFLLQRKYPRGAGAGSLPAKETGLLKVS